MATGRPHRASRRSSFRRILPPLRSPRPAGRFQFGRLLAREEGKLHLLPLGSGARQIVVSDPPFLALPVKLVRSFG